MALTPPTVTIEQAACNALASFLGARLPGVTVSSRWFDRDQELPERAISIILAGAPREEMLQPEVQRHDVIHTAISTRLSNTPPTDLPSTIIKLNAARASYEAHRVSTAAHASADTTNAVTEPEAFDLDSAIDLSTDMRSVINDHLPAGAHTTPDEENTITAPVATDLPSLRTLTIAITNALNKHYVARLYTWRVGEIEHGLQLDVWAHYEAVRDEMLAQIVPLINAAPSASAGFSYDDPVRNGTIVPLGDGWEGNYADFEFDSPRREQTGATEKQGEYRAMYSGVLTCFQLIKAQSPRMALMRLTRTEAGRIGTATVQSATGDPGYSVEYA